MKPSDESESTIVHACGPSRGKCVCRCTPEKRDCGHDFTGPVEEHETPEGGGWSSVTCHHCGMTAMGHDMWCGP